MTDKERIELKECWDSGSHNAYRIRIAELEARVKARAAECGKEG